MLRTINPRSLFKFLFVFNLREKFIFDCIMWPGGVGGVLVLQPGVDPSAAPALEAWNPHHWTTQQGSPRSWLVDAAPDLED